MSPSFRLTIELLKYFFFSGKFEAIQNYGNGELQRLMMRTLTGLNSFIQTNLNTKLVQIHSFTLMDLKSNLLQIHPKVTWIFRQNKFKPELIDCDKLKPEVEEEADRGDSFNSFSFEGCLMGPNCLPGGLFAQLSTLFEG